LNYAKAHYSSLNGYIEAIKGEPRYYYFKYFSSLRNLTVQMSCLRGLRFGQQVSKLSGKRGVTTSWSTLATAFNSKPEPRFSMTRQDVVSVLYFTSLTYSVIAPMGYLNYAT
jgi:hypothetical protein